MDFVANSTSRWAGNFEACQEHQGMSTDRDLHTVQSRRYITLTCLINAHVRLFIFKKKHACAGFLDTVHLLILGKINPVESFLPYKTYWFY